MMNKIATTGLTLILFLFLFVSPTLSQEFEELIVAPEVLFDGAPPEDMYFKPGRILDENTIWFSANKGDIFAGDLIYVYRSIDGGATFTYNETGIPGKAAQVDAFDADIALVSTALGDIYRTTDGGATWTEVYSYDDGAFFNGMRILNENVAVANGDGLVNGEMHFVRTEDKGATWTKIEGIDFLGAAYGYYSFGLGACNVGESVWFPATTVDYDSSFIFRSYDAGATWEGFKIPIDVIASYPRTAGFQDDDNGLISDRRGNVVKSTNGGETWTATNKPDTSSSSWVNGIVHIPGTDILVGMDDIGVFYTSDLGATWDQIATPPEAAPSTSSEYIISGMFLNSNFGYVFTDNGLVLRFKNQVPVNFDNLIVAPEVLFDGAPPVDMYFKPGRILDENTIWFAANKGDIFAGDVIYVYRSIDGGATFTYNETGIPGKAAQVDAFDADIALVSTDIGDIYRTTDGGATWTEVYSYDDGAFFNGLRVLNANVAVANGDGPMNGVMHYVRTEDKGATWTEIEGIDFLGAAYGYFTYGLGASNLGESVWTPATTVDYDSSFIFRSYDAGATWEGFKIPIDVIASYPRTASFLDDDNGLISDRRGNVVKSTNGGETWTATNKPDTSSSSWVNGIVHIPGTDILVGMDDIGAFYTTDLGATWGQISTPPEVAPATSSEYIISGMFLNSDFGYVFTWNGVVLRFEDQVTAISDPEVVNVPNKYHLSQNYPNPFNPETKISFTIPKASDVTIKIYDIQGREVTTLVNASMNAGTHEVVWNGTNTSGTRVATGMYVYTLITEGMTMSKKMVLMK